MAQARARGRGRGRSLGLNPLRQAYFQPASPGFGLGLALMRDHRRAQRQVVGMTARPHADLAPECRHGQIGIGLNLLAFDRCLVVDNHPSAGRKRVPGWRAQRGGDALVQQLAADGLEQTQAVGHLEAGRVHRDQQIGRAGLALVADALDQFLFLAIEPVDLDARALAEVGVERFVGLVVPRRVDVEHAGLRRGTHRAKAGCDRDQRELVYRWRHRLSGTWTACWHGKGMGPNRGSRMITRIILNNEPAHGKTSRRRAVTTNPRA